MWLSLGDLEFCMYFGANLYNKVIRGQRSSLYYYCLAVRMLFPFSSQLGNSQEHFTAIFHQESAFSCSYCLFLSLHIPMYTQRKTKCSNCSIFFDIGSRSRDKLLIIFYYMFGKQTMNWDLVTALIQKAYPFLLATEALLFNIKTNPLIVIIQIRLNFNRQLNCLLFCSKYLPSADLSLALEWYHSSPWQSVLFLHLLMIVSLSSLLKTIIIAQVFRKKNVPIGIWLYSAFFLDIFSQVLLLSHDSWQSQTLPHLRLSKKCNCERRLVGSGLRFWGGNALLWCGGAFLYSHFRTFSLALSQEIVLEDYAKFSSSFLPIFGKA